MASECRGDTRRVHEVLSKMRRYQNADGSLPTCNTTRTCAVDLTLRLEVQQNPVDCTSARLLIVEPPSNEGLGSLLVTMMSALAEGLYTHRTVVVAPSRLMYTGNTSEPDEQAYRWSSLFAPLSGCSLAKDVHAAEWVAFARHPGLENGRIKAAEMSRQPLAWAPLPEHRFLPDAGVWFASELLNYAMRYAPGLAQSMREFHGKLAAAIPNPERCIAVHVRRGDVESEPKYAGFRASFDNAVYKRGVDALVGKSAARVSHVVWTSDVPSKLPSYVKERSLGDVAGGSSVVDGTLAPDGVAHFTLPRASSSLGTHALLKNYTDEESAARVAAVREAEAGFGSEHEAAVAFTQQTLEDMAALAYCRGGFVGTVQSSMDVVVALMAFNRTWTMRPTTWVDAGLVASGNLTHGALHSGTMQDPASQSGWKPPAETGVPTRWALVSLRLLNGLASGPLGGDPAPFVSMDAASGLPTVNTTTVDAIVAGEDYNGTALIDKLEVFPDTGGMLLDVSGLCPVDDLWAAADGGDVGLILAELDLMVDTWSDITVLACSEYLVSLLLADGAEDPRRARHHAFLREVVARCAVPRAELLGLMPWLKAELDAAWDTIVDSGALPYLTQAFHPVRQLGMPNAAVRHTMEGIYMSEAGAADSGGAGAEEAVETDGAVEEEIVVDGEKREL